MSADIADRFNRNLGPFAKAMGIVFDEVTPDRLTGHVDVTPELHQPFGLVHGGVYCSIVESFGSMAASIAAARDGKVVVGVSNTTDFIRPIRTGRIDVVATPIHRGRLQQQWLVEMFRDDGKLAARGHLRGQVLDTDRELAGQTPQLFT